MKKIFVAALALTLTFGSFAQSKNNRNKNNRKDDKKEWKQEKKDKDHKDMDHKKMDHKHMDKQKMGKDLDLSETQKAQMKQIKENYRPRMEALKADKNLTEAEKKARMKVLMNEQHNQMQAILTAEQRNKMQDKMGDRKEYKKDGMQMKRDRMRDKRHNEDERDERRDKMKDELDLSNDQAAKMKMINEGFRTKLQALRSNSNLTAEQKKTAMKELQQNHKNDIQQVLTNEQKDKLKNRSNNRRNHGAGKITR